MAEAKVPPPRDTEYEEHEGTVENLIAKFQSLSAEGEILAQKQSFSSAIKVFSRALEIRPNDKNCLVARSKCFIQVGNCDFALEDANTSLEDDPNYFRGLFQKAEALYSKGDFELALMFYHRGNRLRPELAEFRIGIQKAQEAIENSIGKSNFKIRAPAKKNALLVTEQSSIDFKQRESMEAKLLGELYDDKVYLQNLLHDKDFIEHPDNEILTVVNEGLRYLTTRIEFWRQQNPLYARKREKKLKHVLARRHFLKPIEKTTEKRTLEKGVLEKGQSEKREKVKKSEVPQLSKKMSTAAA